MMNIGVDIFGGDYAPDEIVSGAILARQELSDETAITLIGDENTAKSIIEKHDMSVQRFNYAHTTEHIGMGEHPAKAFSAKLNSSIGLGLQLLVKNQINGFASAGNTGAILVGSMKIIKTIPGIIRPCITANIPRPDGSYTLLIDVGINPDCKPDVLYQYGILGSIYSKVIYNTDNPKIGLLNIGTEEEKGNLLTRSAYELMKNTKDFNFIGNIEGNDIFNFTKVDVIICDGFIGNVLLKTMEGFYFFLKERKLTDSYLDTYNFANYGGTPVLGINSNVVIAHGASKATAIANMIKITSKLVKVDLPQKIRNFFNK
jgi:phosphate acyltransferase